MVDHCLRGHDRAAGGAARTPSTTATTCAATRRRRASRTPSTSRASCPKYIRPAVLRGQGAVPLGGALGRPGRHRGHRRIILELFPEDEALGALDPPGAERIRLQGLPARICWLGYGERARAGLAFNEGGRARRDLGTDRHRPRPPRLRLGRLAQPRDRGHEGRHGRRGRLAATGVMRHVDAGYEEAVHCAKTRGVDIPMLE